MRQKSVIVIGAGLAGSEAAAQLAKRGVPVDLYEMRPKKMTEAHTTHQFAELVCSNSFGSDVPFSASRILKEELELLEGFVLNCARQSAVPAGASLAVDRVKLSEVVTSELSKNPLITIHREELFSPPADQICIIATGPLTSPTLAESLQDFIGGKSLYFYDAISPIVSTDSLDMEKIFAANRYDKGETPDFLNIPLNREQYDSFVDDLLSAEVVLPHDFEEARYFESCLPIETIASRGRQTLSFGPMKPVGLTDPKTGRWAHAVIQLRAENQHKTAYNLVGFQTKMKYKEQERVFRKLPGLENAEFLRLGSMHRNTYIDSPRCLLPTLQLERHPHIFIGGQLTGTEGYLESTATGLLAGWNAARLWQGLPPLTLPRNTMLGSLLSTITDRAKENFQPTNVNMGILPPLEYIEGAPRKKDKALRNKGLGERAISSLKAWINEGTSGFGAQSLGDCRPAIH
jgi:methylenetetrahydrofolate--tRNA-(uracil-5-)-methyltransferase